MDKKSQKIRLALFGESDVGKSHYGGQLLSRIELEACALKMRGAPDDISPFEEVRQKLNSGLLASHTSSGVYRESVWPVIDESGRSLELTFPDYAGEQLQQLIDTRRVGQEWLDRIQSSHGWILMIRPKLASQVDDIFSRPLAEMPVPKEDGNQSRYRSVQARLVELLQMLLYVHRLQADQDLPSLAILLSCWDELHLPNGSKPDDVLERTLPLLYSFVRSQWPASKCMVFGLSALGTELSKERADEKFINLGPENFGYVVQQDGEAYGDLTIPIVRLADTIAR